MVSSNKRTENSPLQLKRGYKYCINTSHMSKKTFNVSKKTFAWKLGLRTVQRCAPFHRKERSLVLFPALNKDKWNNHASESQAGIPMIPEAEAWSKTLTLPSWSIVKQPLRASTHWEPIEDHAIGHCQSCREEGDTLANFLCVCIENPNRLDSALLMLHTTVTALGFCTTMSLICHFRSGDLCPPTYICRPKHAQQLVPK